MVCARAFKVLIEHRLAGRAAASLRFCPVEPVTVPGFAHQPPFAAILIVK